MKLEHPIASLIDRCQTICVPECCGIDAYDFSPIHIASFLIMWRGVIDESELQKLREQINSFRQDYGSDGRIESGVTVEQMNQSFLSAEVDDFSEKLLRNIDVALEIVTQLPSTKIR